MDRLQPFKAEYAISNRSECRHCSKPIEKDSLRIAKRVRSLYFDGMEDRWYHRDCIFLINQKPESIGLIADFDNIKWDDQEFLKHKTERRHSEPTKSSQQVVAISQTTLKRSGTEDFTNFKIKYASSGDKICYCEDHIKIGEIQVDVTDPKTNTFEEWHLRCFADLREDSNFYSSGSCLPGFKELKEQDQAIVLQKLPSVTDENSPPLAKRSKTSQTLTIEANNPGNFIMMMQNKKFIDMKNYLITEKVTMNDMISLLTYNKQRYAKSIDPLKNALADRLAFGAVNGCSKCTGKMKFISGFGYVCVDCQDISRNPEKRKFRIPPKLRSTYRFLKYYTSSVEDRLLRSIAPNNLSFDKVDFEEPVNYHQSVDREELKTQNSIFYKTAIINPKTDFQGIAKIYQSNGTKYAVTLGSTDIQFGRNSFYKLQILQYINQEKYSLFRSWGRIGTQIGGSKVDVMALSTCIEHFQLCFFEKTGNMWYDRDDFIKHPYKMQLIEVDDDTDLDQLTPINKEIKSNLDPKIQSLMNLIFNLNIMKNLLIDFKIDINKMPLGKISKSQIEKAYRVLQELQGLIISGIATKVDFVEASNRFYMLIPHSFGISVPPVLDDAKQIKQKCDMLNAILDMEIAYNLINGETNKNQHPLDAHYEKLRTKINILDSDSEEFKIIHKFVKNTHAYTHSDYTLEITHIFGIERQNEGEQYKFFKHFKNRKLLWHGSRTTNFAGILSQGLRIAPPEAPASGYMFGKGIYFADMVSKSANYCFATSKNTTGLLLLCEVALGNMLEKHEASPNLRLPRNRHSTFGRGKTFPDPNELYKFPDGTEVPYGTPVYDLEATDLQLLYNEYIVYNPAQVRTRYLVQVKFHFHR